MELNFLDYFHQSSKDPFGNKVFIPHDKDEWPDEWKTIYYKSYERFEKIDLSDEPPTADFFSLIKNRKSKRNFNREPLTKYEISLLLKYSCGITGPPKNAPQYRAQPSGGARFPIEVYLIVFRSGLDLKEGLYHYNVRQHKLDVLWKRKFSDQDLDKLFTYSWAKQAGVAIIMSAVFWRSRNKYGERGYRYILLEAGHIGQNIYLVSQGLNLKCCALGGINDTNLEKLIDIDGINESIIYGLVVGK